jgi:hypothetical protein
MTGFGPLQAPPQGGLENFLANAHQTPTGVGIALHLGCKFVTDNGPTTIAA